jgi:uncharacterized protein YybS (DUF2232 family)
VSELTNNKFYYLIITVGCFLLLPTFSNGRLAEMALFLPVPIMYLILKYGYRNGSIIIKWGIIFSGIISLFAGTLPLLLFSFTFLPLGVILAYAVKNNNSIIITAAKGVKVLLAGWVIYFIGLSFVTDSNPYQEITNQINLSIDITYDSYSKTSELSEENIVELKEITEQLKLIFSRMFPGLVGTMVLLTVWINLIISQKVIYLTGMSSGWQEFRHWKLPDYLVWSAILTGVLIIIPYQHLNDIGYNLIIITSTLYFMQGLSILSNLFCDWSVPQPVRIIMYLLMMIQAFGILLLMLIGLADVWIDFRKIRNKSIDEAK